MELFSRLKTFFSKRTDSPEDGYSNGGINNVQQLYIRNKIRDSVHAGDDVVISFGDLEKRYGVDMPRRINLEDQEKQSRVVKGTVTGKKLITGPTDCWMLEISRIRLDSTGNKRMKSVVLLEDEILSLTVDEH